MAQYTRYPVVAPPQAPARESSRTLMLRAYSVVVFIVAFTPTTWVNLLGNVGTGVLVVAMTITTLSLAIPHLIRTRSQAPFPWRRLPWTALSFTALALLSVLWSAWRGTTALTSILLLIFTVHALVLATWLRWSEILGCLGTALKWIVGASLAFELWVALVLRRPVLPNGSKASINTAPDWMFWSQGNLLGNERIQGIVGNANLLAGVALFAIIVFSIQLATTKSRRGWLIAWLVVAALLFLRAGSATAFLAVFGLAFVAISALLVRHAATPRSRKNLYLGIFITGPVLALTAWLGRGAILELLDRSSDLTGREFIWDEVLGRAVRRPWLGWGHASPWLPWDPAFRTWILEDGRIAQQAHNMWVDVFFQLGVLGTILLGITVVAFVWRSWFFAADRPRWDLNDKQPYAPVSLLPVLFAGVLVTQSFTESGPMMLGGWMVIVLFSFKLKIIPIAGIDALEPALIADRRP